MARRPDARLRVLVAVAAVVSGLIVGLVVAAAVTGGGDPDPDAPYQPFLAGRDDRLEQRITEEGPVFYPDPRRGTRALYLDRRGGELIALHVIPPGGRTDCPVQWNRDATRYETCDGEAVDPDTLDRFVLSTEPDGEHHAVYVDLRATEPGPAAPTGG